MILYTISIAPLDELTMDLMPEVAAVVPQVATRILGDCM
jgi:hypothetical protein